MNEEARRQSDSAIKLVRSIECAAGQQWSESTKGRTVSHNETRLITGAERWTVLCYGLLVFVIAGGLGVYFPLFDDRPISAEGLATYAMASLAPLFADIFVGENYWKELSKLARLKIGLISAFGALFSFGALKRLDKPCAIEFAAIGTLLVLYLLYRISILSGKFEPEIPPRTEDGGPKESIAKPGGAGLP